jgi:hypothetical protein
MSERWFHFYIDLPPEYDDRTRIAMSPNGNIIVAHPEHPPKLLVNGELKPFDSVTA